MHSSVWVSKFKCSDLTYLNLSKLVPTLASHEMLVHRKTHIEGELDGSQQRCSLWFRP